MALDGLAVAALAREFQEKLIDKRIDKISQPEHDELLITLHGFGGSCRLLLSANANVARASLTGAGKKNPAQAPLFCMLLRKHIGSGRITGVSQPGLERVLEFAVETRSELGDLVTKTLVIEMMGRHSNIMLLDENRKILDSIKRVDFSVSTVRQVLPGLAYEYPPGQGKQDPLVCDVNAFLEILKTAGEGERLDSFILHSFTGVSPLIAREIACRATGIADKNIGELEFGQLLDVATELYRMFTDVREGRFSPCFLQNRETKKLMEFSAVAITQYGELAEVTQCGSMAEMIDGFYAERDRKEHMAHRSAHLVKLVSNHIERCAKKLELQRRELGDTEKMGKWQQYGELITANLYRIERGMTQIQVENYYEDGAPAVTITLDDTVSPSQNAKRYFKKYSKAKSARRYLTEQICMAEEELAYLETVEEELAQAETEEDLAEIADELAEQGYIRRNTKEKRRKQAVSQPMEFVTSDGFTVLAGRNNKQNDYLTIKTGRNNDLWFHTKNIPGSHVLLKYQHEKTFTDRTILEAAQIAAYFSKARHSSNVPVDYTAVKNVKKPSGAKPGFVIYTEGRTAYVTPPESIGEQ